MVAQVMILAVCALMALSMGCSVPEGGYESPTLDKKTMDSDVVVHGVAISTVPDRNFPGNKVYSVEFEVRCIYKGGPLEEIIWIDHVGEIPGHCFSTNLVVGERYLVYLKRYEGDRFTSEFTPDPAEEEFTYEILGLCETTVSYPKGFSINYYKETCPQKENAEDCMPPPVPPTMPPEVRNETQSPPTTKVTESKSSSNSKITVDEAQPAEGLDGEKSAEHELDPETGRSVEGDNGSETVSANMALLALFLLSVFL